MDNSNVALVVEEALGPGIDFQLPTAGGAPIAIQVRPGGAWLGFDRAVLVDSDDGSGRSTGVIVALPGSTYPGCRIEAELAGVLRSGDGRMVIVARLPGIDLPPLALARVVARMPDGQLLEASEAGHAVIAARAAYRVRRASARISGGRAWLAAGGSLSLSRFSTPHSEAEYSLSTVPAQFTRGLDGLLDVDERVLYWVERPPSRGSLLDRVARRLDGRSALLLVTDRQLLFLIDHAQPDRFLFDWGVDVELIPVEHMLKVDRVTSDERAVLRVGTANGVAAHEFQPELSAEVDVASRLLRGFVPGVGPSLPRRMYTIEPVPYPVEHGERFRQGVEAEALMAQIKSDELLGFVFSPARPGQRRPAGLALTRDGVVRLGINGSRVTIGDIHAVRVILSPLIGRIEVTGARRRLELSYPAPFSAHASAFVRTLRRLVANG